MCEITADAPVSDVRHQYRSDTSWQLVQVEKLGIVILVISILQLLRSILFLRPLPFLSNCTRKSMISLLFLLLKAYVAVARPAASVMEIDLLTP